MPVHNEDEMIGWRKGKMAVIQTFEKVLHDLDVERMTREKWKKFLEEFLKDLRALKP